VSSLYRLLSVATLVALLAGTSCTSLALVSQRPAAAAAADSKTPAAEDAVSGATE